MQYVILNMRVPLTDRGVKDNCNFATLFQKHYVPFLCVIFHDLDKKLFFLAVPRKNYRNPSQAKISNTRNETPLRIAFEVILRLMLLS